MLIGGIPGTYIGTHTLSTAALVGASFLYPGSRQAQAGGRDQCRASSSINPTGAAVGRVSAATAPTAGQHCTAKAAAAAAAAQLNRPTGPTTPRATTTAARASQQPRCACCFCPASTDTAAMQPVQQHGSDARQVWPGVYQTCLAAAAAAQLSAYRPAAVSIKAAAAALRGWCCGAAGKTALRVDARTAPLKTVQWAAAACTAWCCPQPTCTVHITTASGSHTHRHRQY